MKYALWIAALATVLVSCNNNNTGSSGNPEGCYSYIYDKDSVLMQLKSEDGKRITGDLMFHFFEKDRNKGTIVGVMKGDTLFATYSFTSEGTQSYRAVVFLKKGETFTEGYGKLNDSTGEPDFSDRSALHFDSRMILKKTDCAGKKPE